MDNNVVISLFNYLKNKGFSVFRFNFSGVGFSSGKTSWTGKAEQDDLVNVAKYATKVVGTNNARVFVIGYSYGSMIACSVIERLRASLSLAGVVSISYPYSVVWALSFFNRSGMVECLQKPPLEREPVPTLFVAGDRDQFTSAKKWSDFTQSCEALQKRVELVKDRDHFWFGSESLLAGLIEEWGSSLNVDW